MNVFQSMLLGFVQGLTEFLPVSSSGHLILVRELLGLESSCMMYDILLHLGTLVPVFVFFGKEFLGLFRPPFGKMLRLIIATLPAAVAGFLLSGMIDDVFGSGKFLCVTFALTAVLLLLTERLSSRNDRPSPLGTKQAVGMGLMQVVALLPGLSRSGSTVFGGIAMRGNREDVAKFSFLMSVPVIFGSACVGLIGVATGSGTLELTVGWWETLCGIAAATVGGMFAVKIMMKIIVKAKYKPLAFYLFGASILSLVLALI